MYQSVPIDTIVSSSGPICLVGGGPIASHAIQEIADWATAFVGVDGGADHLLHAKTQPEAVIGDLDSLSEKARARFADVLHPVAEQSTTDFEKALQRVASPVVIALGFTGARIDHSLSVLNVMARMPLPPVVLVDAHDASFVLHHGVRSFDLPEGCRVSIMPLATSVVSVEGVVWPFVGKTMRMDGFNSASNAAIGRDIRVETDAPVLITLPRSQLATAVTAVVPAEQ